MNKIQFQNGSSVSMPKPDSLHPMSLFGEIIVDAQQPRLTARLKDCSARKANARLIQWLLGDMFAKSKQFKRRPPQTRRQRLRQLRVEHRTPNTQH